MDYRKLNINKIVEGYHPRRDFSGKEKLKRSIEKDGLIEPLLVRKDGEKYVIIAGMRRFSAVQELKWETVPCVIKDVDEKTAAHLSYLTNSEDLRKNLNPLEVSLHIKEMRERFGYSVQELVDLGYAKDDQTIYNKLSLLSLPQEIQEKIARKSISPTVGYKLARDLTRSEDKDSLLRSFEDFYAKCDLTVDKYKRWSKNRIIREKCQEKNKNWNIINIPPGDIPGVFIKDSSDMSELADESVGLVVTSPPYWVGMEYEEGISFEEHLKMLEKVFSKCARKLVPGGKICVNFGDIHNFGIRNGGKPEIKLMGHHYHEILVNIGLRLIDTIIWKKCTPGKRDFNWSANPHVNYHNGTKHTSYRILNNIEYIYVFQKEEERQIPFDIENESKISKEDWKKWVDAVWEIPPVRNQKDHPAQFPEELPRRLIRMFSFKGDIVLDCFGGTMTTVKVANELGRIGIGYEKDEKYKSAIMKKLGFKKEDLKKPETVAESKDNWNEFVHQLQGVIDDIVSTDQGQAKKIKALHAPIKEQLSKEDIAIEWKTEEEDPVPCGSPSLPQIYKPDDYEGAASNSFPLGKTGTSD